MIIMKKNMRWKMLIIAILLIAVGVILFLGNSGNNIVNNPNSNTAETRGVVYNVTIRGMAFSPTPLSINVGDTVVWTNYDEVSHTVTSDTGLELQSGYLATGKTYSHTFTASGTYTYHCSVHPYMKGTIIVR